MKQWIIFILLVAAGLIAGPVSAQSKDFAGSWTLDVAKTGSKDGPPMVVITLTEKEFTARLGSATGRQMTFRTDGTETDVSNGTRGKASWKATRLEATIITPGGPETVTFWREGAWLVVEASSEKGPMKFFFTKTPAGL